MLSTTTVTGEDIVAPGAAIRELSVRLISHASVVIDTGTVRILTDPWFFGRAFNDSWELVEPAVSVDYAEIDYLWISHEHPDHFHIPTLAAMPDTFKQQVTVLFQQSIDHPKMVAALRRLGFANITLLPNRRWVALGEGVDVLSYPFRQIDSALAIRAPGGLVLNLNDCDFGPQDLRDLRKLVGAPDLLLNQFSIAGFDGVESELPPSGTRVLNEIVAAHRALDAKVTIPFASFARFCCPDNAFINAYSNTPGDVARRFAAEGLATIVLRPGQATTEIDNDAAVAWWDQARARAVARPLLHSPAVSLSQIEAAFDRRYAKVKAFHGLFRRLLDPITIDAGELGSLNLDFAKGTLRRTTQAADLAIEPQPLLFLLDHDFGLQTLGVSGRYRILTDSNGWMTHRVLFAMINADFGLGFRKLLRFSQLAFLWHRRDDMLHQVAHIFRKAKPS